MLPHPGGKGLPSGYGLGGADDDNRIRQERRVGNRSDGKPSDRPVAGKSVTTEAAGRQRAIPVRARLLSFIPLATPPLALGVAVAVAFIAAEGVVAVLLKRMAPQESFGILFLLGVLVVSTLWGPGLAAATSVLSAVAFEICHDWPHGVPGPFDLESTVRLGVFLVIALLTNFVASLARASRHRANHLAEQQTALRRVATLVARAANPSDVFAAVAVEMVRCLHVPAAFVGRYEPDGTVTRVATRGVDPQGKNEVEVPIRVDGRLWGVAGVASAEYDPLPPDTEALVGDFADLISIAIANAATRAELIASRARIVTAADDARRRIERDLHDGAQQRVVSLALKLRMAEMSMPPEFDGLKDQLSRVVSGLTSVCEDLQDISRGIHPAILSRGGLGPALKMLARRCTVPVALDLNVDRRLPETAEVAAYFIVSEALTNVAKHAQAAEVTVSARLTDRDLELTITDDGVGGAGFGKGSGLIGLTDRVEALGGHLHVASPPGGGTTLRASIPVTSTSTGSAR
jgi:signal transduction histidine kinase